MLFCIFFKNRNKRRLLSFNFAAGTDQKSAGWDCEACFYSDLLLELKRQQGN